MNVRFSLLLLLAFSCSASADISYKEMKLAKTEDRQGTYEVYSFLGPLSYLGADGKHLPISYYSQCEDICAHLVPQSEKKSPYRCFKTKGDGDSASTALIGDGGKIQRFVNHSSRDILGENTSNPSASQFMCMYKNF